MIEVSNVTKRFGTVTAVNDLSFTVKPGMVTGFLGPNGAGKSTTMRLILGIDNPTSGTTTIDGKPYREWKNPLTKVGSLLDAKAVHPNRSARDHLRWVAASNGIPASRVTDVLNIVGLSEVAKKKAGGFSLGMSQRLGLATALLGDPEILLLDEPVNGLDPEGIHWVRELMKALAAEGRTVLVSSHLLSEMSMTADHLIVIGKGELVADTSVRDFISTASTNAVVVRSPHLTEFATALQEESMEYAEEIDTAGRPCLVVRGAPLELVGDLAFSAGISLHELSERNASLEEAYIEQTGDKVQYQSGSQEGQE